MTMLHDDMTLARLRVYAQSIKESKGRRMSRSLKRSNANDQGQTRFKKKDQTQEERKSAKVKFERGGGSQNVKPTCITCDMKHHGECILGTGRFYGCRMEGHKVTNCPNIASKGKEGKQVALVFKRMMLQKRGVSMRFELEWTRRMMVIITRVST